MHTDIVKRTIPEIIPAEIGLCVYSDLTTAVDGWWFGVMGYVRHLEGNSSDLGGGNGNGEGEFVCEEGGWGECYF